MNRNIVALITTALLFQTFTPALADPQANARSMHFSTAMVYRLGDRPERDGDMSIAIDTNGNISGTYHGTAPTNDAWYNKNETVTGTLTGQRIHLEIGPNGELHVDGSLDENGITATGSVGSQQLYDFIAAPAASG